MKRFPRKCRKREDKETNEKSHYLTLDIPGSTGREISGKFNVRARKRGESSPKQRGEDRGEKRDRGIDRCQGLARRGRITSSECVTASSGKVKTQASRRKGKKKKEEQLEFPPSPGQSAAGHYPLRISACLSFSSSFHLLHSTRSVRLHFVSRQVLRQFSFSSQNLSRIGIVVRGRDEPFDLCMLQQSLRVSDPLAEAI